MAPVIPAVQNQYGNEAEVDHLLASARHTWEDMPMTIEFMRNGEDPDSLESWLADSSEILTQISKLRRLAEGAELTSPQMRDYQEIEVILRTNEPIFLGFLKSQGLEPQVISFRELQRERGSGQS